MFFVCLTSAIVLSTLFWASLKLSNQKSVWHLKTKTGTVSEHATITANVINRQHFQQPTSGACSFNNGVYTHPDLSDCWPSLRGRTSLTLGSYFFFFLKGWRESALNVTVSHKVSVTKREPSAGFLRVWVSGTSDGMAQPPADNSYIYGEVLKFPLKLGLNLCQSSGLHTRRHCCTAPMYPKRLWVEGGWGEEGWCHVVTQQHYFIPPWFWRLQMYGLKVFQL